MVYIELMKDNDWDKVSKIYKAGIESNIATLESDAPSWEKWDMSHKKEGRFVAKKDMEIVGFAVLSGVSHRAVYSGVAELSVYVEENSRGEGIGEALIKKIVEFSDNNNIWTLQSNILEENEVSIELNEKCGFRKVGYREKIGKDKYGLWRNIVFMERRSKKIGNEGCDMMHCKMHLK